MGLTFLCIVLVFHQSLCFAYDDGTLSIAAFNVQVFGVKKMENPIVRKYLEKIILRYDLILIQEIRDSSLVAIHELMDDVRKVDSSYDYTVSARLGRTTSKEQYAYIYKRNWLTLKDQFIYNDVDDVFEREPFIVRFESSTASVNNFAVVGIHTSPGDAENEISNLTNVYDAIVNEWGLTDVIFMGDFNAGCSYTKDWPNIKLATDPKYYWLIDNSADTTTKRSDCPYDRIVISGDKLIPAVLPLSPNIFRFDEHYGLPLSQVIEISDHYPVEFKIRSLAEKSTIKTGRVIEVEDTDPGRLTKTRVYTMKRRAEDLGYDVKSTYTKTGAYEIIKVWKSAKGIIHTAKLLHHQFYMVFPEIISQTEFEAALRLLLQQDPLKYLPRGHGLYKTLYDYYCNIQSTYKIQLECNVNTENTPKCNLQIER